MIILYDSLKTWREVVDEYPVIGGVWIRGDWKFEDIEGVKVPLFELTEEPVVAPAMDAMGRCAQCHPFGEEALKEFAEYWADYVADGRLQILEGLPADWKPEGWQEAPLEDERYEM